MSPLGNTHNSGFIHNMQVLETNVHKQNGEMDCGVYSSEKEQSRKTTHIHNVDEYYQDEWTPWLTQPSTESTCCLFSVIR